MRHANLGKRNIWKKFIHDKLERRIRDPKKRNNSDTWKELLDFEETKTQHKQVENIEGWNSDNVDTSTVATDPKVRLLLQDIAKAYCRQCPDTDCQKAFQNACSISDFESWTPCPEVITFLME